MENFDSSGTEVDSKGHTNPSMNYISYVITIVYKTMMRYAIFWKCEKL